MKDDGYRIGDYFELRSEDNGEMMIHEKANAASMLGV